MTMKDDGLTISTNNLRECRFYWRGMLADDFQLPPEPSKSQDYCSAINSALGVRFHQDDEKRSYIRDMINSASTYLVPQKELEWLNRDQERMCFWIWCCCRLLANEKFIKGWGNSLNLNLTQGSTPVPYSKLAISEHPKTAKERHQLIIEFLDRSNMPLETKRTLLEHWKQCWGEVYSTETYLWLDNSSDEQCEWFASYITNSDSPIPYPWFIPTPTTTQERYDACIAAFDIWPTDTSTKKLFVIKMKKAWGQKKHRLAMKKKNKKSYNFTLSSSTKEMLDKMADNAEVSRNEFLERLIKAEHSKQAF
ncbi:hypothetical protein ACXQF3_003785 [Vibrio fluvialis]|nr:hypothetical protein [Vibrio fluvialis]MBY8173283.1 hypothetical protein [Vibrio fluvialis]